MDLKDRLDLTTVERPAPVDPGHRTLRRRAAAGLSAIGVAAVIGSVAWLSAPREGGGPVPPAPTPTLVRPDLAWTPPADLPPVAAQFLVECWSSDELRGRERLALLGSGQPELIAWSATSRDGHAVIRSADGRYWAACNPPSPVNMRSYAELIVYSTDVPQGPRHEYQGATTVPCCGRYDVSMTERISADVAEVEVELIDGTRVRVAVNEGYFSLDATGGFPEGTKLGVLLPPINRMTLYDERGGVLAVADRDEMADDSDFPAFPDYPSLAGWPLGSQ